MGKSVDLVGKTFGRWTVLRRAPNKGGQAMWACLCNCGIERGVAGSSLRRGISKSCGCLCKELAHERIDDLTGRVFGRLTVVRRSRKRGRGRKGIYWIYSCECGKKSTVLGDRLRSGHTKSCGCLRSELLHKRTHDLTGCVFGMLTVMRDSGRKSKTHHVYWECLCKCGKTSMILGDNLKRGKTISCGCLLKRRGPNHPSWDVHKTKTEREQDRKYSKYAQWRTDVFKRDDHTCQICDVHGGVLRVHHLDAYHWAKSKRILLSNGITLCKSCHDAFHSIYGRRHNKRSQYVLFEAMHKRKATASA